jgi:hypothetical protein
MSIVASWKMPRLKPLRPFIGLSGTSLRHQSCSKPSRSHPPPREAESMVRSEDFWSALWSSRPRAMPLGLGNPPQNNERGPLIKTGRHWSIPSQQRRKPPLFGTAYSTIARKWCSLPPQRTTTPRRPTTCHAWLPPSAGWLVRQCGRSKPLPKPPGPQVFSRAIRKAPFPAGFRAPTTITKYSRHTKPELWLTDYRLVC